MTDLAKQKFINNSAISITGTILAGFFNYLFHFSVSHQLTVPEYGQLQTLITLFTILTVFGMTVSNFMVKYTAGFAASGNIEMAEVFLQFNRRKIYRYSIMLVAVLALISPLLRQFLQLPDSKGLLIILAASLLSILAMVDMGWLQGLQQFKAVAWFVAATSFCKLVLGYFLAVKYHNADMVVGSLLVASLIGLLLSLWFRSRSRSSGRSSGPATASENRVAVTQSIIPTLLFSAGAVLLGNMDTLLVKHFTSAELTGYYSALELLSSIILAINTSIIAVLLPQSAADTALGNHRGRKNTLRLAYMLVLSVSSVAVIAFLLFPKFFVGLLFGPAYEGAASFLWLFALMAMGLSVLLLEANAAYAQHKDSIIWVLLAAPLVMIILLSLFHATVGQAIASVTIAVYGGYGASLLLRIFTPTDLTKIV